MNLATFEISSEVETKLANVFGNRVVWIHKTFHTNGNWDPVSAEDTLAIMLHIDCTTVLLKVGDTVLCIGTKLFVFCQRWILQGTSETIQ